MQVRVEKLHSYSRVEVIDIAVSAEQVGIQAENARFIELSRQYSCDCESFHCSHAKAARANARQVILANRLRRR